MLCTAGAKHALFTDVEDWFVVSDVSDKKYVELSELATFKVGDDVYHIIKSPYEKCPRCWKYTKGIEDDGELCPRCKDVVEPAFEEDDVSRWYDEGGQ